jgi:hypothetical protein
LKLSDEKIGFDGYSVFSQEILLNMASRIEESLPATTNKASELKRPISGRIEVIEKLTKCTTFLNLIYLSFLKEHENGQLTKGYIEDFLDFLKTLWQDIESGKNEQLISKNPFAQTLHDMLKFKTSWGPINTPHISLRIAWDIVQYWAKKHNRFFPDCTSNLSEIVNKIIFFSNYETICQKINVRFIEESKLKPHLVFSCFT